MSEQQPNPPSAEGNTEGQVRGRRRLGQGLNALLGTGSREAERVIEATAEANVDSTANEVTMDISLLAAADGTNFATEPQWVGSVTLRSLSNRRVALFHARMPPMRFKVALRLRASALASARVTSFAIRPYDEQLQ